VWFVFVVLCVCGEGVLRVMCVCCVLCMFCVVVWFGCV